MSTDESLATGGDEGPSSQEAGAGSDDGTDALADSEQLAGELAVLEAENERLRRDYARLQQSQYRRSAAALAVLGAVAGLGGLLFPTARSVLWALAGTGLFLGVLTYYLSPEQFLPATVGREIYGALASNERAVVDELGVSDRRLYVPVAESRARLYVPQSTATSMPDEDVLSETFVVADDHRGVALRPTGQPLFSEFEQTLDEGIADDPAALATQLREALVEQFELIERSEQSVPAGATAADGELTVGVTASAYGPLDQFDHPVPSLLGVGLARGLETPVEVRLEEGSDRVDDVVTCRWPPDENSEQQAERDERSA